MQITVLQPDPIVPLGSYSALLEAAGWQARVVELWHDPAAPLHSVAGDLATGGPLLILGGRMAATDTAQFRWLADLETVLPQLVAAKVPIFGICLGAQILAHALGGKVETGHPTRGEDGPITFTLTAAAQADPVFGLLTELPAPYHAYASHNDAITYLPAGARLLAENATCPVQGFRIHNAWGVQYHPEADANRMREWAENSGENGDAMYVRCLPSADASATVGATLMHGFLRACAAPNPAAPMPERGTVATPGQ